MYTHASTAQPEAFQLPNLLDMSLLDFLLILRAKVEDMSLMQRQLDFATRNLVELADSADLMTVSTAAEYMSLTPVAVYKAIERGRVPARRVREGGPIVVTKFGIDSYLKSRRSSNYVRG
jgi:excisionase family DNA binding protein